MKSSQNAASVSSAMLQEQWNLISAQMDGITGISGSLGYLVLLLSVFFGYYIMQTSSGDQRAAEDRNNENKEEEEDIEPQRNFTFAQLRFFDGTTDPPVSKHQSPASVEPRPVYLSVRGTVFDVSRGRGFYGPDGPYETFAGHECGVALAKMSFEAEDLDDLDGCNTLSFGERTELDGWYDKFRYFRCYPVKGKLVPNNLLPDPDRILTDAELAKYDGRVNADSIPEGYAAAPIFVGVDDKIFDVSFGGVQFYGPGGPYEKLAGRDASRSLATMQLDEMASNTDDLTEKQIKTMKDWANTFEKKKMYPIVGRLNKAHASSSATPTTTAEF